MLHAHVDGEGSTRVLSPDAPNATSPAPTKSAGGQAKGWRLAFLRLSAGWNRFQVGRVIGAVVLIWLIGAVVLYLAENSTNEAFGTPVRSLWNVWILLFAGEVETPKTIAGRITAMVLMVTGVGLAGLFTASVASLLVERYLRRTDVSHFEMNDHLVLCNWAPRALEWIREVHCKIITDPRPIVIIHDNPDEIDLPDKQDEPAFNDVYIVKGRSDQRNHPESCHGFACPLDRYLERRTRRQTCRRKVDPHLHRDPSDLPWAIYNLTSLLNAITRTIDSIF